MPPTEITKRTQRDPVLHKGCHHVYEIQGSGPPVVLIQGVGVHGGAWAPQISAPAAHYECLWFDNRGLGRSQPLGAGLSIAQMAEDTLALMDSQGWASAHLVGHSMGGLIALHTALSARERVRSLSLLCSFPHGRDATRLTPWMLWTGLRTRIGTRPQRRKAFVEIVMPPAAVRYNATPRLHELAGLPTLVVSAEHDHIASVAVGQAMAAAIPGARFVQIPDASRGASLQHPERVNALLREHLGAG